MELLWNSDDLRNVLQKWKTKLSITKNFLDEIGSRKNDFQAQGIYFTQSFLQKISKFDGIYFPDGFCAENLSDKR